MGKFEYFIVYDLCRIFCSFVVFLGIVGNVVECCFNYKLKGVEGIYDCYDYFEECRIVY